MTHRPHDPDDMSHRALVLWSLLYVTLALAAWVLLYLYMPVITALIEKAQ